MSDGIKTSENTLRKLGAHLRWQIEKCGVDAEGARVMIIVNDEVEKSRIISGFLRDFDEKSMVRVDDRADSVAVHGVTIFVGVAADKKQKA